MGSPGVSCEAHSYEYAIDGYDTVCDSSLCDGHELLLRVLREAVPQSLTFVLISSLRDFADVLAEEPALVLSRVMEVAIQGGLEWSEEANVWVPDSSNNNSFDQDAAAALYASCFSKGLPMSIVSRHAVPLLPMQLAKS